MASKSVGRRSAARLRPFLVYPSDGNRKKGEAVWAVKASPAKPMSWLQVEGEFTLSLGQGWKTRLPAFFEHLAALRSQSKEASSA